MQVPTGSSTSCATVGVRRTSPARCGSSPTSVVVGGLVVGWVLSVRPCRCLERPICEKSCRHSASLTLDVKIPCTVVCKDSHRVVPSNYNSHSLRIGSLGRHGTLRPRRKGKRGKGGTPNRKGVSYEPPPNTTWRIRKHIKPMAAQL